jgi:hypothetical protein
MKWQALISPAWGIWQDNYEPLPKFDFSYKGNFTIAPYESEFIEIKVST